MEGDREEDELEVREEGGEGEGGMERGGRACDVNSGEKQDLLASGMGERRVLPPSFLLPPSSPSPSLPSLPLPLPPSLQSSFLSPSLPPRPPLLTHYCFFLSSVL